MFEEIVRVVSSPSAKSSTVERTVHGYGSQNTLKAGVALCPGDQGNKQATLSTHLPGGQGAGEVTFVDTDAFHCMEISHFLWESLNSYYSYSKHPPLKHQEIADRKDRRKKESLSASGIA